MRQNSPGCDIVASRTSSYSDAEHIRYFSSKLDTNNGQGIEIKLHSNTISKEDGLELMKSRVSLIYSVKINKNYRKRIENSRTMVSVGQRVQTILPPFTTLLDFLNNLFHQSLFGSSSSCISKFVFPPRHYSNCF